MDYFKFKDKNIVPILRVNTVYARFPAEIKKYPYFFVENFLSKL